MKKTYLLLTALLLFVGFSNAQKKKIIGSWLATQVEVSGEVQNINQVANYTEDGKMIMMGMEVATWEYNKKSNEIEMKSDFDKDFNGHTKILSLTDKEFIVEKDGVKVTYKKLDFKKIATANKNSGLIGMWEFDGVPYSYSKTYVTFKEPDKFTIIEKQDGMKSTMKGLWIFNKKDMSFSIVGLRGEDTFNGKNKIIKIDDEVFELENNGKTFKATRKAQSTEEIKRLTFSQEDFFTEDGNYKYENEEDKLPWKDPLFMMMDLVNVKQLVYNCATLISGTDAFENKLLKADVNANPQDLELNIDNIFIGFDRYNLPEDTAFPSNPEYSNPLYPLDDSTFRVVGNEQITTPAGTFDCTILEVYGDRETRRKLWLVNNKFGVFAKIIEDNPDERFGSYHIYELQEIN